MALISTAKTDFLDIQLDAGLWPAIGSFIFGFDIADDQFKKIDSSGNITIIGGGVTPDLVTTLGIGNSVGLFGITNNDGTATLDVTQTGVAILYSTVGYSGAPRLTLDQSLGLTRMSSINSEISGDPTRNFFTHVALNEFDAPVNYFSTGNVGIGTTSFGTSSVGILAIGDGTAPTGNPTAAINAYSEGGQFKYRDSSGNIVTI